MEMRLKPHLAPERPSQTALEEKTRSYTLTTLPLPENGTTLREEIFHELPIPPVGKENPGGNISSSSTLGHSVGALTLISHHRDCRGIFGTQTLRIHDKEGGKGLQ